MPFAAVNQTLLVVVADVPSATLFPVAHEAPIPGPSDAVPDALAAGTAKSTTAAAALTASQKRLMSPFSHARLACKPCASFQIFRLSSAARRGSFSRS